MKNGWQTINIIDFSNRATFPCDAVSDKNNEVFSNNF